MGMPVECYIFTAVLALDFSMRPTLPSLAMNPYGSAATIAHTDAPHSLGVVVVVVSLVP